MTKKRKVRVYKKGKKSYQAGGQPQQNNAQMQEEQQQQLVFAVMQELSTDKTPEEVIELLQKQLQLEENEAIQIVKTAMDVLVEQKQQQQQTAEFQGHEQEQQMMDQLSDPQGMSGQPMARMGGNKQMARRFPGLDIAKEGYNIPMHQKPPGEIWNDTTVGSVKDNWRDWGNLYPNVSSELEGLNLLNLSPEGVKKLTGMSLDELFKSENIELLKEKGWTLGENYPPKQQTGGSLPRYQGTNKSEVNMLGNTAEEQALINAQTRSKQVAFPTEYYNLRDAYDVKRNWEDQNINAYFSGAPYPHQAQLDSLNTVYDNLVIPKQEGGGPEESDKSQSIYDVKKNKFIDIINKNVDLNEIDEEYKSLIEDADVLEGMPYPMAKKGGQQWMQRASKSMKKRGTIGSFTKYCGGKVTLDCIRKGLRSKSKSIKKKAAFAKASWKVAGKMQMGGNLPMYQNTGQVDNTAVYNSSIETAVQDDYWQNVINSDGFKSYTKNKNEVLTDPNTVIGFGPEWLKPTTGDSIFFYPGAHQWMRPEAQKRLKMWETRQGTDRFHLKPNSGKFVHKEGWTPERLYNKGVITRDPNAVEYDESGSLKNNFNLRKDGGELPMHQIAPGQVETLGISDINAGNNLVTGDSNPNNNNWTNMSQIYLPDERLPITFMNDASAPKKGNVGHTRSRKISFDISDPRIREPKLTPEEQLYENVGKNYPFFFLNKERDGGEPCFECGGNVYEDGGELDNYNLGGGWWDGWKKKRQTNKDFRQDYKEFKNLNPYGWRYKNLEKNIYNRDINPETDKEYTQSNFDLKIDPSSKFTRKQADVDYTKEYFDTKEQEESGGSPDLTEDFDPWEMYDMNDPRLDPESDQYDANFDPMVKENQETYAGNMEFAGDPRNKSKFGMGAKAVGSFMKDQFLDDPTRSLGMIASFTGEDNAYLRSKHAGSTMGQIPDHQYRQALVNRHMEEPFSRGQTDPNNLRVDIPHIGQGTHSLSNAATYAQLGAQVGDEIEMSEEELRKFISMGGEVEILNY